MKALIEAEHFVMATGGKAQSIKTTMSRLKLSDPAVAEEGRADAIKDFDRKPSHPSKDSKTAAATGDAKPPARRSQRRKPRQLDAYAQA